MTNQEFIDAIGPIIQRQAKEYGYATPSAIIAQACLESAYGRSSLAAKYHNYFGMKCGSGWNGKAVNLSTKEEYTPGTLTTITDAFRVYDDMESGVRGYFEFIQYPRYSKLKNAKTPLEYLQLIKAAGYATSSAYVTNVMAVVDRYDLRRFDSEAEPISVAYAAIVTASALRVRSGASLSAPIVQVGGHDFLLPQGMTVAVIQEQNGFGRLADITGWVSLEYLKK